MKKQIVWPGNYLTLKAFLVEVTRLQISKL